MPRSENSPATLAAFVATTIAATCVWAPAANAQDKGTVAAAPTESIVVTGPRLASDAELTEQVATALDSNRYLDASRITVTTTAGVVHLDGLVGDAGDLIAALRTVRRVAGARRVIDNLEMCEPDGGGM